MCAWEKVRTCSKPHSVSLDDHRQEQSLLVFLQPAGARVRPASPTTDKHQVKTEQNAASTPLNNILKESSQIPFKKLSVVPLMLVWSRRTGESSRRCSLLFHANAVSFGLCVSRFYKTHYFQEILPGKDTLRMLIRRCQFRVLINCLGAERVNHLSSGDDLETRLVSDVVFEHPLILYLKLFRVFPRCFTWNYI